MSTLMRLQKVVQQAGAASRRAAFELVREGRVRVDGQIVREPGLMVDPEVQDIRVDARRISIEEKVLYALNKPAGYVTSMKAQGSAPCLGDLLAALPQRVVPVGRLDKDVSGLLLLTNDGDHAQALAHPRYSIRRTYWAACRASAETFQKHRGRLLAGIELDDGPAKAEVLEQLPLNREAQVQLSGIPSHCILLSISVREGRHHFVKRLLGAAQLPVVKLARIAFGPYSLDDLALGELRLEKFQKLS